MFVFRKRKTMRQRVIDLIFGVLAAIGFFIIVGAAGTVDYHVEMHESYSMISTIKMLIIGLLLIVPASVRSML
jgi:hypothetical protein